MSYLAKVKSEGNLLIFFGFSLSLVVLQMLSLAIVLLAPAYPMQPSALREAQDSISSARRLTSCIELG